MFTERTDPIAAMAATSAIRRCYAARLRFPAASATPAATNAIPSSATGVVLPPVLGSPASGLTIEDGVVVGVVEPSEPTVVEVLVAPSALNVVDVVESPTVVVVVGATVVVVVGATVVVVVGATVVVVVGATVVVVVGATVVVVVGATVVVVVGATVVVVVGATVVVVVGATVVVVVGATVVVVVGATVVVVVGATVVVVVGATVVVVVGATVVVVVGATVVVVVGATVVVVVGATASGNWIERNDWSPVTFVLLVETRIWQLRKSGNWFTGESAGSLGDRQLNSDCGLSPLKGVNAWFGSVDRNVAVPVPSARTGDCDEPRSQCVVGDQPGAVWATPSHCSSDTSAFGANPVATTVKGNGFPDESPGTTNGLPEGVVIDAKAMPASATRQTAAPPATTIKRRLLARIRKGSFPIDS